jgi:hypothetical protein
LRRVYLFFFDRFEIPNEFPVALASGFDEAAEKGTRVRIIVERALRVPLDSQNEVIAGGAFQGFDDVVVRAAGRDLETVTDDVSSSLVMAGVGGDDEVAFVGGFEALGFADPHSRGRLSPQGL